MTTYYVINANGIKTDGPLAKQAAMSAVIKRYGGEDRLREEISKGRPVKFFMLTERQMLKRGL